MKVKFINNKKLRKTNLPLVIGYFNTVHVMHYQLLDYYANYNILTFTDFDHKKDRQLYTFEERMKNLEEFGPNKVFVFDINSNNMTAEDFMVKVLKPLAPTQILVGTDFKFGSDQKPWWVMKKYFDVETYSYNPEVSTTKITNMLKEHKIAEANAFLFNPYYYQSKWINGNKIGRKIGYRTINLKIDDRFFLPDGVYVSRTTLGSNSFPSVTFVGQSRTFGVAKRTLETHILHSKIKAKLIIPFYRKHKVKIEFLDFIRDIEKFTSQKALTEAIAKDVAKADKFFAENKI